VEIRFSKTALRALRKSDKAALIHAKIRDYANDPAAASNNVTRLVGRAESRLRVQDWRVIFRVEDGVMHVDDIGPRGSIY
jgi:mRNA interferase RelE/StbE